MVSEEWAEHPAEVNKGHLEMGGCSHDLTEAACEGNNV